MATIEARNTENGTVAYRAKVRIKGFPAQSATFERKTDAREWAKQTEAAIKDGRYFKTAEAKKHTVKEMVERYLEYMKHRNPKRHPWVQQYLDWWVQQIGPYALSDVTKALIIEQRDNLMASKGRNVKKRTPATINRYMTALSHAFTVAMNEWEWVQDHPMKKISKLPEPRGRVRFLDDDERKRLLEACQEVNSPYLYMFVVLALSTGARHGELINLHWRDVDLSRKAIVLHDTKNKERRVLPLAHHALELIKAHYDARDVASELVFPAPRSPNQPWASRSAWETAMEKAQLKDFRFHDLRHSAASYLAMNGASLAEIAEVLGHKTLAMVKRYSHLSEAHTAKVVERMNQKIFG